MLISSCLRLSNVSTKPTSGISSGSNSGDNGNGNNSSDFDTEEAGPENPRFDKSSSDDSNDLTSDDVDSDNSSSDDAESDGSDSSDEDVAAVVPSNPIRQTTIAINPKKRPAQAVPLESVSARHFNGGSSSKKRRS